MGCSDFLKNLNCCRRDKVPKSAARQIFKVAIGSTIMTVLTVIASGCYLTYLSQEKIYYNSQPRLVLNFLLALVTFCLSLYQLFICGVLLRQASSVTPHGYSLYYLSLWYVSHLNLLTIYCSFMVLEIIVEVRAEEYVTLSIIVSVSIVYMGIFISFVVVAAKLLPSAPQV